MWDAPSLAVLGLYPVTMKREPMLRGWKIVFSCFPILSSNIQNVQISSRRVTCMTWMAYVPCVLPFKVLFKISRSLTGPSRHQTSEQWAGQAAQSCRRQAPASPAHQGGSSITEGELTWKGFTLLSPGFPLRSSPEADVEWFAVPWLLLEMEGRREAAAATQQK